MKKIIIILVALVCFSGCAHRVQSSDYMVIEKECSTVNEGIARMKDGIYKLGKTKFKAPSNTYTVYFTNGQFN